MTACKAYDQPTDTTAVDGEVTLDGPDGIGLSMPEAAAAKAKIQLRAPARGPSA